MLNVIIVDPLAPPPSNMKPYKNAAIQTLEIEHNVRVAFSNRFYIG